VVDGLARALVVPCLLGVLEVTDVPNEGGGTSVGRNTTALNLVVFVVGDEPFLVLDVKQPPW
jgi:hypothetical protein